jgi:hypothetical protein
VVQSQPRQIVHETLSQKKTITKMGWWSGSRCRTQGQVSVLREKKKKKEEEEILRAARSTWLSIGQDWPGDHGGNPERAPECFRSSGDE